MSTKAQHESMMNVCILGTGLFLAVLTLQKLQLDDWIKSFVALGLVLVVGFIAYYAGWSDAKKSVPKAISNNPTNEVEF